MFEQRFEFAVMFYFEIADFLVTGVNDTFDEKKILGANVVEKYN
jgi:hypothetical protein